MIKSALHFLAVLLERLLDRLPRRKRVARVIDPYIGYAGRDGETADWIILRGRVLSKLTNATPRAGQGRFKNFRQILRLFITHEVGGVRVSAQGVPATSDEEGYFALSLPCPDVTGWHDVPVQIDGLPEAHICPVFIPRPDAQFIVISDIDDTMLETGAYALWRNLWTSTTGNSLTRHVFPDAVDLMARLSGGGRNPVFYVSSSPWNLHGLLRDIFARTKLTLGPMFLRDLGVSDSQFVSGTHGDHKGGSIDTILAALPDLPVILIGDTGQHDARVYLDAIGRHAARIKAVVLREPGPGPNARARAAMDEIRATGTPLLHGADYTAMAPERHIH